jgi:hypothetical protein
MGFTFSHPALILPLRYLPRKIYSLNGLIVGSMIPDFEYFIRLDNVSTFSHTFIGLFLFDLPAAIFVLILYHQLIRPTLVRNLPHFLKSRLASFATFDWLNYFKSNWVVVICSILFGALTHLFWDGFTSANGYFVIDNPIMETRIMLFDIEFYTYKIIKHLSSLIGVLILLFLFFKLEVVKNYSLKPDKNYWMLFMLMMVAISLFQLLPYEQNIPFDKIIKKIVSSSLFSLLVTSLYYRINLKKMDITELL